MDESTILKAHEALRRVVDEGRLARKQLAAKMWPDMPLASAQSKLSNCLNPHKQEYFSASEILRLQLLQDRYDYLQFEQEYLGHPKTEPLPPGDLETVLWQKMREVEQVQLRSQQELEHFRALLDLRSSPPPAATDPRPVVTRFSRSHSAVE